MSSASARFTEYSRTNERACRWDDQRRRRNMRLSTVLQRRTTRRLGAGEKENGITPAVGTRRSAESLWTLFDRRFLFHFFLSSFFFFLFFKLHRSFLSLLLHLVPSVVFLFSSRRIRDDWTNDSTATNKFTVDCFYSPFFGASVPRSSGMARREEAFARINRAVPFDTTFHHRTDSNPFNRRPSFCRAYLTKSQPSRRPRSVASGGWLSRGFLERGRVSWDKSTDPRQLDSQLGCTTADNSDAASTEILDCKARKQGTMWIRVRI